ncbi:hypothetical protein PRIPAC_85896 [Pristionchus pacificus]|uniref:Uncharacterized protein n=1 Tax=Pristionchus pacificus TaxID=54126 RepID=A0A2A6BKJ5_PRIPA|nr:hypothetical protein PRIPAC_85896 [Pristionchus pacificus]|eukprot:PDM66435.1 hypothetical protein PRIPAC_47852 [Pristionchus pacificus]
MAYSSKPQERERAKERCMGGKAHLHTGMKILVIIGILVILALLSVLYFKFKKAMFVMMIPAGVTCVTIAGMVMQKAGLVWPIIAISCFHMLLSIYALVIFSFYFIFKPFYIIMVLNWAFDTLHNDKTASYYIQCAGIFSALVVFLLFNLWQASVAHAYHRLIIRTVRSESELARRGSAPTILVVNNKPMEYASTQY